MQKYLMWVVFATVLLLAIEILAGRHKGVYRKGDLPLAFSSFLLGRFALGPMVYAFTASFYHFALPQRYEGMFSSTPLWIAFPVALLVGEFVFYWVHRWAHQPARFPALWKIHRTHHSGRHMNVLLTARLNFAWFFINPAGWVTGLALYLGWNEAVLIYLIVLQLWNLITHSNFRWDDVLRKNRYIGSTFRAMEHVLVSPGIHHTHHGYGKDGKNYRNFCTVLSLYDWIFGTLHIPEGRPAHYGIPHKDLPWLEELLYPLIRTKTPQDT